LPAAPPEVTDIVHASAFAPTTCSPGEDVLVQLFLHTPKTGRAVGILAREADPEAKRRGRVVLEVSVQHGQRIDVLLEAPVALIDEPQQSLIWRGQPHSFQFVLRMPGVLARHTCQIKASMLIDSIPVGRLRFTLAVGGEAPTSGLDMVGTAARRYREAFLSHSHEDRVKVLTFAQLLHVLGIKYFQDIVSIETMEDWEWRIRQAIDHCDLFLLFWTASAAGSHYVHREIEYALARQKASPNEEPDIMPVFLEPKAPDPPWYLQSRHFDSLLRLAMRGAEAERKGKSV
jgi:hypothetical protein